MTTDTTEHLSTECAKLLAAHELYTSPGEHLYKGLVIVRDDTDRHLFEVTPGIDARDLAAILAHGNSQFLRGVEAGAEGVKASLRNLIGAAEQKDKDAF